MAESPIILTFEVGGTNTHCGVFRDGEVIELARVATPAAFNWGANNPEPVANMLRELTATVADRVPHFDAVGISMTGMMRVIESATGWTYGPLKGLDLVLSSPNIDGLESIELFALLESVGWGVPVHVENDANAVLRSATDFRDAVGINMGTGIAAAVKENGFIKRVPPFWSCIEIGHGPQWPLPEELVRPCACGQTGCLEAAIGSRALRERYEVRPEEASEDVYEWMRSDLVTYGAPAIVDTAKNFAKDQILLSGKSILGFNANGEILDLLQSEMQRIDPELQFQLHLLDLPDTSGMLGVALSLLDYGVSDVTR